MSGFVAQTPVHDGDGYSWGGDIIVAVDGVALTLGTRQNYGERNKLLALAHKLAAAPDMLDALEAVGWWLATVPDSEAMRDRVLAAIMKAEGRIP